jgi:hypothetical protein
MVVNVGQHTNMLQNHLPEDCAGPVKVIWKIVPEEVNRQSIFVHMKAGE